MSNFDNIGGIYAKDAELRQDIDDVKQSLGYSEEYAPQTKSRGANDTQYFTGIDVQSNGSTILSADVIDTDARIQIDDIADFVGYLSYLDGVNYDISGINPTVKQGRFWGNWQNQKSIRPIDSLGNYVKVDWTQDWEIGFAFLIKDKVTYTSYTFATGVGTSLISWAAAPATFICHEAYSSEPTKFIAVRKADTTHSDYNLWSVETGFDEGCLPDTWYFVKIGYNSTTKTLSASVTKDFENWNTNSDTHSDRTPYTGTDDYISFAGTNFYSQSPNDDIILDLANTYIKQNGIMIWGHFDGAFAGENHYQNPAMPWRPLQDGYSNFWFELTDDTLSPWLNFSAKNNDAVIDWGDGSGEVALDTLTPTHTYSKAGRYVVKVKGVTGIDRQYKSQYPEYLETLKHIELNSEVTVLSGSAFFYCLGVHDIVANSVTSASDGAIYACTSLMNISIPLLSTIPQNCFRRCSNLKNILLPNATSYGAYAIYEDINLKEITIASTVTEISDRAITNCNALRVIHTQATTPPTLGTNMFAGLPSDYIIYVPVGYGETYKAASGWSTYADHILEEGQTPNRAMLAKFNTDESQDDMR